MRALFIGRGPFSLTLQKVLREVAPTSAFFVAGREAAVSAIEGTFDFAVVVTPPQAHAQLLPRIWARGKPCWVEKPFGSSAKEAEQLLRLWESYDKRPTYVDFPHNRTVAFAPPLFLRPDFCLAAAGGPGPARPYMNGLWDWGTHIAAMYLHMGWTAPWQSTDITYVVRGGPGRTARGTVGGIYAKGRMVEPHSFMLATGNGFGAKAVSFAFSGPASGGPVPVHGQPLQIAMRELVEVAGGAPAPKHNNWNPAFAARVTGLLEGAFGAINSGTTREPE